MAKPKQYTREQWAARMKRREKLRERTDDVLHAGFDAARRGEDIAAAMETARARHTAAAPARLAAPPAVDLETAPRIRSSEGWDVDAQRTFLQHLAGGGCVSQACAAVGLSRQSAYALRRHHPNSVFAIGWDVAIDLARQALLDEATERALSGREQPVWYHGEQVGTRVVHNDRLLMFLLARKPEPVHPRLSARELHHLFPALLRAVDVVLPPDFSQERIAELAGQADEDAGPEDF
ncbi:hypothetical protein [Sphingomonas sp.]|uniref:hypothetical protein n=1 Tax=Sphingomonas sp. TaxID=28214 RepID=UPI001B117A8B|nr:hypothetical protein [Sphingomonas sp.]MBO9715170.1 hypothetical protein [Sphingomonas sp.]